MKLEDIRKEIDSIDSELKELLLKRFNCSYNVAMSKIESGNTVIYRADREQAVLNRLRDSVPEEVLTEYLAIVRRYMESSRMYQYGLIFDRSDDLFRGIFPDIDAEHDSENITASFMIPSAPNALSSKLCMIGDHGCVLKDIKIETADDVNNGPASDQDSSANGMIKTELTFSGNIRDERIRKLLYQLSMETESFEVIAVQ